MSIQFPLRQEHLEIKSAFLNRDVKIDCYLPVNISDPSSLHLLLINDGQNMDELGLAGILENLLRAHDIVPLLCVGIHAGDRMMEYGTACCPDYLGRGNKARSYAHFIFDELIPFIKSSYRIPFFYEKSFAGFSMGGLSALDLVWNNPQEFSKAGIFSGSLWWRTKSLNDGYNEETDRIAHDQIKKGKYVEGLKFFFQTGTMDETMDRNNNGIIDSIDDTLTLIDELVKKGYRRKKDIRYFEVKNGTHDVATWAKAMPEFLKWGWGRK